MWDSLIQGMALSSLDQFHFLRPWWGLLTLPFLFPIVHLYRNQRLDKQWSAIFKPHILRALLLKQSKRTVFDPLFLYGSIVVLYTLVLMGPTWVQQPSPFSHDEAGMVIVLDVSDSMLSRDIQPSRLTRAKHKIRDLLILRNASKTALVAFAGTAHSVLPLTDDADLIAVYLDALKPAIMPREGKFPEKALPLVDRQLASLSVPGTVLLITDGLSADSDRAFAEYFSSNQHQLLVLGVGTTQASNTEHQYPVLDVGGLKKLTKENRGDFVALTIDDSDVKKINRRTENYFVPIDDENIPWVDFGYYLLFVAVFVFIAWFRKGVTLHWGLVLFAVMSGVSAPQTAHAGEAGPSLKQTIISSWMTPDQQGRWHFGRGEYLRAAQHFQEPVWKGLSFYMAEEFMLAAECFSRIDNEEALFNRANALAHAQHYVAAVKLYERILQQNTAHKGAEKNRAVVRELMDAINRMSEFQADEMGSVDSSKQLGDDEPQRAEGAERQVVEQEELEQFSAEEVLQDESVNEMWMRSVQQDPADFLSSKFFQQLEAAE